MKSRVQQVNEKHFGTGKPLPGENPRRVLTVSLPYDLDAALRLEAKMKECTVSKLVQDYIMKGLKR